MWNMLTLICIFFLIYVPLQRFAILISSQSQWLCIKVKGTCCNINNSKEKKRKESLWKMFFSKVWADPWYLHNWSSKTCKNVDCHAMCIDRKVQFLVNLYYSPLIFRIFIQMHTCHRMCTLTFNFSMSRKNYKSLYLTITLILRFILQLCIWGKGDQIFKYTYI